MVSFKLFILFSLILSAALYFRIKFFKLNIEFTNRKNKSQFVDLNGIVHFHTVYSDGSGRIQDLIETAGKLKADFLISSDHNTLKPKEDGIEGYYACRDGSVAGGGVEGEACLLYFAGEEINTEFGHLLAIGIEKEIKRGKYKEVLSEIKKQKGASVICHPHNWWTPWKNLDVEGYDVIEIINLDSQWRGMNPLYMLAVIFSYRINSFYALHFLSHKPVKTIKFWDGAQKHKFMKTGIASTDAHSNVKVTKKRRFKFPKYSELFSVARTHILLENKLSGNLTEDKKKITEAVRRGRCYFSFDLYGFPKGFYYYIDWGGEHYFSGDSVPCNMDKKDKNVIIYAGIDINPKKTPFIINLFKNGIKVFSSKSRDMVYEIVLEDLKSGFVSEVEPIAAAAGIFRSSFYRIEIDVYFGRKKITYLYSNNIEIYM